MKHLSIRVLSTLILLSVVNLFITAQTIWDGTTKVFFDGEGTQENPYLISTASQLAGLAQYTNKGLSVKGEYYRLENDIFLNDTTNWQHWKTTNAPTNIWTPIGTKEYKFLGSFDGNNYTIYGVYHKDTSKDYVGLFGNAEGGKITNVNVRASFIAGGKYTGGILGGVDYSIFLTNCFAECIIEGAEMTGGLCGCVGGSNAIIEHCSASSKIYTHKYSDYSLCVGGLIGHCSGTISKSYVITNIENKYPNASRQIGGLVGSYSGSSISQCCAFGSIQGIQKVGGLIGYYNANQESTIKDCYANVEVISAGSYIGGGIGSLISGNITNCYIAGKVIGSGTYVGGFVGGTSAMSNHGETINSYFDTEATTQETSAAGCLAQTTASMKKQSTYVGWDFDNVWKMEANKNNGYPYLAAIQIPVQGIALDQSTIQLKTTDSLHLTATIYPIYALDHTVIWTSSNDSIATIEDGVIKAILPGTVTITATTVDGGYTAQCLVSITQPVTGIVFEQPIIQMQIGTMKQLQPKVLPENASNKKVIYTSSNPSILNVDNGELTSGCLIALQLGSSTITATTEDGGFTAQCAVFVLSDVSTDIEYQDSASNVSVQKIFTNGSIYILRNGEKYTIDGRKVE